METTTNLKRRTSSREGAAKKVCSGPPCPEDPLEGPSNAFSPKPLPQQAPPHLPFPPPLLSLPPPILPLPPPPPPPLAPPPPPQHHTSQHAPPDQKCSCDTMSWIYAHTCIHTCVCAPIPVCVCVCVYVYIYIYIYVCTHAHTHLYTHIYVAR